MSSTLAPAASATGDTRYKVLGAISLSHFLNDLLQSLIIAIYPLLKGNYDLNFTQIGLLTLTYQTTASLLQPLVGLYTDKHPQPYSLVVGMGSTLTGLLLLSCAPTFPLLLLGDGTGWLADTAKIVGWAFAVWGTALYWWAAVLYIGQARRIMAATP